MTLKSQLPDLEAIAAAARDGTLEFPALMEQFRMFVDTPPAPMEFWRQITSGARQAVAGCRLLREPRLVIAEAVTLGGPRATAIDEKARQIAIQARSQIMLDGMGIDARSVKAYWEIPCIEHALGESQFPVDIEVRALQDTYGRFLANTYSMFFFELMRPDIPTHRFLPALEEMREMLVERMGFGPEGGHKTWRRTRGKPKLTVYENPMAKAG